MGDPGQLLYSRAVQGFDGGDPSKYPGAFPPPPGVTPNLAHPPDAGRKALIAGLSICVVIITILFAVRAFVKIRITRRILLEDVTCLLAWAITLIYAAGSYKMIYWGLGHHSWDIPVNRYAQMLKWLYITSIIYEPAAFFTKATILLLLARIFAIRLWVQRGIYALIVGLFVAYIPIFIVKIDLCRPIAAYYDPTVAGTCLNLRKILIIDVAFAIATDAAISIIPIPLTWSLRMNWRKKLKIVLLLGAGGVAVAATILRLVKLIDFLDSQDVATDFVVVGFLTMLELSIGLACSCLPALNILIASLRNPSADANSPRSGHHHGRKQDVVHPWTGGLTWHWLGETTPHETTSTSAATGTTPSAEERRRRLKRLRASGVTGFELELAMLSSQDIVHIGGPQIFERPNVEFEEVSQMGLVPRYSGGATPWFTGVEATACDGHREGWLDACAHSEEQNRRQQQQPSSILLQIPGVDDDSGSGGSKKSKDISSKLSQVSGNKPWEYIWDGRNNSDLQVVSEPHEEGGKS